MARFASLTEAADYLRMSERSMRRLRERGLIPSANPTGGHVLFDLDELDAWVACSADPRPAAATVEERQQAIKQAARNRRRRLTVAS